MRTATGQSEPDVTKIRELEERLDNFRIQVSNDLTIRGNAWQGYALNAYTCDELGRGGGPPPPPEPGACCLPDGTCEEVTVAQCIEDGGTFFGGLCSDADCPQPTGACCVGSDCTIETEDDCTGIGGTYQGDDTTCDPNPCADCGSDSVDLCKCGFAAYDGSGTYYLTQIKELFRTEHTDPPFECDSSYDIFTTLTYTLDGFGNCTGPDHVCSGGGSGTHGSCDPLYIGAVAACVPTGLGCNCLTGPLGPLCTFDPPPTSATNEYCEVSYSDMSGQTQHEIFNFNLSDEYTTAMLIANAEALFIDTYGACPEGCTFGYTLSGDESCVTVFCTPA